MFPQDANPSGKHYEAPAFWAGILARCDACLKVGANTESPNFHFFFGGKNFFSTRATIT